MQVKPKKSTSLWAADKLLAKNIARGENIEKINSFPIMPNRTKIIKMSIIRDHSITKETLSYSPYTLMPFRGKIKKGAIRELNPGPPVPKTGIIPLDQSPLVNAINTPPLSSNFFVVFTQPPPSPKTSSSFMNNPPSTKRNLSGQLIAQNIIMIKGKPSPPVPPSKVLPDATKMLPLASIFVDQQLLGWEIIDMESCLYSEMNISIQSITMLTSLYMRIIEKLNTLQDPRENYFSLKMQKLMAEPYVIRCFNKTTEQDTKKDALQSRRKELQQRLEKQVEKHNHRKVVQQVMIAQEEKEEKFKNRVKEIVEKSNKNLEERIRRRTQIKQMRSSLLSTSQLVTSDGGISIDSPKFASNRTRYNYNHSQIHSSSSFELQQDQSNYFNALKRQIQQQQSQQRLQRKIQRQKWDSIHQK